MTTKKYTFTCCECEAQFQTNRSEAQFCGDKCRKAYHNRAQTEGREMYHLVMTMRYARDEAARDGAWTTLCKIAERAHRQNGGKRKFDTVKEVKARNPGLNAVVVCKNYRAGR